MDGDGRTFDDIAHERVKGGVNRSAASRSADKGKPSRRDLGGLKEANSWGSVFDRVATFPRPRFSRT